MTAMELPVAPPPAAPGKPRVLECPACGGAVTLRAVGHSVNVACSQCGSLLDVALADVRILKKAHESQRQLLIPLGTRGKLEGIEWEAIGFQERSTGSGAERYPWQETLLFNPRYGFRFLSCADGHWTLYRVIKSGMQLPEELTPPPTRGYRRVGASSEGPGERVKFARFYSGKARVDYVLGEFYWRVKVGDTVHVTDSIAPPYIQSVEKDGEEINLSLGSYFTGAEIAAAFAIAPDKLPKPKGIAPNQPSPFAARVPGVRRATLLALAAATLIQFGQAFLAENQAVYSETLVVDRSQREETRVTQPFDLTASQTNLCVESQAALSNNWAELRLALLDETTQVQRGLTQGMEYYSGVDGGESWSEGSPDASQCFSAVPAGRYRLLIQADAGVLDANSSAQQAIRITATRGAPIWSNWLALLLTLLPYPLYLWMRHHSFEYNRWVESDFTPEGKPAAKEDNDE